MSSDTALKKRFSPSAPFMAGVGLTCLGVIISAFLGNPMMVFFAIIFLLVVLGVFMTLLTMPRRRWWTLWLTVLAVAAFGPLLDILFRLPVNWIIGSAVLGLPVIIVIRKLSSPRRYAESNVQHRQHWPLLGMAFVLYTLYFALQTLRPDVEFWSALMSFRSPLIGLSAYIVTAYALRTSTKTALLLRVQQFSVVFVYFGIIVAAYGIFQSIVGFDRLQAWGLLDPEGSYLHNQRNLDGGTAIFRVFSTMRRNETFGVFLYLNIVVSTAALYFRVKQRRLILLNLAISTVSLLLSLSLTNLVVPMIWFALIIVLNGSKRLVRSVLIMFPTAIGIMLLVNWRMDGLIFIRFAEHLLDGQQGVGRLAMLQNWILELAYRPFWKVLLGSGICTGADADVLVRIQGMLEALGVTINTTFQCGWILDISDNWFATHSLEVGVLGLALFWFIFVMVGAYTLPTLRRRWNEPERSAWTLLALGLLALFPSGFVGALILYMPITIYFWSLMAMIDAGSATLSPLVRN